jgi:hypothetical protein
MPKLLPEPLWPAPLLLLLLLLLLVVVVALVVHSPV